MNKIQKDNQVIVIAGKCKGQTGVVSKIIKDKVIVEGINLAKKHVKSNPNKGIDGGIVEKEMPMHISNVAIYNVEEKKKDKIGFRFENNKKIRYYKSNNKSLDV